MRKIVIIIAALFLNQTAFSYNSPLNFSEISFKNNKSDWIEIKINSPLNSEVKIKDDKLITKINPDQISDEKYILVHFKAEKDKFISKNNILHIYTKNSGLTATTEQITLESDSKLIDAVCWKNNSPTSSELNDIRILKEQKAWTGECVNSDKIEKNQSIVKKQNSGGKSGWKVFKHPTPGKENKLINLPPVAVITIQKGSLEKEVPFSLNLDGSDSYDPENDEIAYKWIFPEKTIKEKKNPSSFKFENSGTFEI
ncbi:hypothetical protein GF366_02525, partial [Candidatus Peregrinibacteria bacterium]|nr:hypothetical protein [Candidatus Peregrinibacteria bacterium]